jgi:hypothetical protein
MDHEYWLFFAPFEDVKMKRRVYSAILKSLLLATHARLPEIILEIERVTRAELDGGRPQNIHSVLSFYDSAAASLSGEKLGRRSSQKIIERGFLILQLT